MIIKGLWPIGNQIPSEDNKLIPSDSSYTLVMLKETILIPSDSVYMSTLEKNTRLQLLLNSIHQRQDAVVQLEVANESLKMQGRLLFITICSALMGVLYKAKKEQPKIITSMALLVGIFWYGVNVHKLDIENRRLPSVSMIMKTEEKLINMLPNDNRIYYLDFAKADKSYDEGGKDSIKRKIRKLNRFITPDLHDIVFNMLPLLIVAIFYHHLKKHPNGAA